MGNSNETDIEEDSYILTLAGKMQTLQEALLETVEREFAEFKESMLRKTKEEIFNDYHIINFYHEIRDFLNGCELDDEQYEALIKDSQDGLFEGLWREYLRNEYASVGSYEDIEDFISDYVDGLNKYQEEM